MKSIIKPNAVLVPGEDIVAREIEGEMIIIPITGGIGDAEDELFSLNETGRAIWKLLDGKHSVAQIIKSLEADYAALAHEVSEDVHGLLGELLRRRMIVEQKDR